MQYLTCCIDKVNLDYSNSCACNASTFGTNCIICSDLNCNTCSYNGCIKCDSKSALLKVINTISACVSCSSTIDFCATCSS